MSIKFENVGHAYKGVRKKDIVKAIDNINLSISDKDEFIAVVGKTGSGKSTLISHMNGLLLPTSGKIEIFDYTIDSKKTRNLKLKPIRKRVGFVFQFPEYQLFEETVYKDICFAPKNFGFKENEIKENVKKICDVLKIDKALLEKSPFNLSGGQMRKVAVAGILAYNPDILILDEPTRGLDPLGAEEIMEVFNYIHTTMHKTIVLISHDMDLVYKYATRVVVMADGSIKYDGSKESLFKDVDYKSLHLEKPKVLEAVDHFNKTLGYNLDYNIYDIDDLILKLKEI